MPRRRASDVRQAAFTFEVPCAAARPADLAGFDRQLAVLCSEALKGDPRSREEIAGAMSALLDEDVSRWMLDGYASPARGDVNVSAARLFALIAVTERFDLLNNAVARIGAALLVGDEVHVAHLGHIETQIAHLQVRRKKMRALAMPVRGRGA